jgi:hypothetical protein
MQKKCRPQFSSQHSRVSNSINYNIKQIDKLSNYYNILHEVTNNHFELSQVELNAKCISIAKSCGLRVHPKALAEMGAK